MLEFIQLLKQRYQSISQHTQNDSEKAVYQHRIDQQILAEAYLRKIELLKHSAHKFKHLAVIGPTQSGKSTLVNVLLNSNDAGVSPLAGYTVHSQGFCNAVSINACAELQQYFGRYQQFLPSQLPQDRYDCYGLTVNSGQSQMLPDCVVWDTPDFDSIDASGYSEALIRTIALADALILVVSKEKYADQSVWDLLTSIQALQQPTLICINKLAEGTESMLIHSLQEKWQKARTDGFPVIIPLFYQKQEHRPVWPAAEKDAIKQLVKNSGDRKHAQLLQNYLSEHWQSWLEPVLTERRAHQEWLKLIDEQVNCSLNQFQRDYLNHPHYYETFQNALAALLNLLELPGLAGLLSGTRKILTWPFKQLNKLGKSEKKGVSDSHEIALLNHLAEHFLIQLVDQLLEKDEDKLSSLWWKNLIGLIRNQKQEILAHFNSEVQQYHHDFQGEVNLAAHRLYERLQEQPLVLNSLRATRVTTDAAAVALSLQVGGIGLHDLIIAPAMLSLTSLLAESAIGSYMNRVEIELKQKQLQSVREKLFVACLRSKLAQLPEKLSSNQFFKVSEDELQQAEQELIPKKHGLRIL